MVSVEARIGVDGVQETGAQMTFDGTNSSTPDGDVIDYYWAWIFDDDPRGTSNPDRTKRIGPEVTYTWSVAGTYQVELKYGVRIRTDDGVETASDTATTEVTVSDASSGGATEDAPGGITDAREIQNTYAEALDAWAAFTEEKTAGTMGPGGADAKMDPDMAMKIRLWNVIADVIRKSKRAGSALSPETVYTKLGIDSGDFEGEYWDDNFDYQGSLTENLGFGADGAPYAEYHIDQEAFESTKDNVSSNASEFVTFGRKLIAYREGIENNCKELVALVKGYGNLEPKKWDDEFRPADNQFLEELRRKPYEEQISILATIFEELTKCHAGKVFLGELFANRYKDGCIDPFNVLYPPEKKQSERTEPGGPIISVREGNRSDFFDSSGKLKLQSNRNLYDAFKKLIPELNTGAVYFLSHADDWRYAAARSDAEALVATFHARLTSKYWSKEELKNKGLANDPNDGDITTLSPDLRDRFETVATAVTPMESGAWSMSDSGEVTKALVDHSVKYSTLFPTKDTDYVPWDTASGQDELPSAAVPLKFGLVVLSAGTTVYKLSQEEPPYQDVGRSELTQLTVLSVKYAGDMAGIGAAAGVEALKEANRGKIYRVFMKLGPYIDVILLAWDVEAAVDQWHQHDYDAAWATMVGIGGTLVIAGAEAVIAAESITVGGSLASTGLPALVVIGALAAIGGTIWGMSASDPEIANLVAVTRFGHKWNGGNLDTTDHAKLAFRFTHDGTTNYPRQLTKFASLSQPINLKKAALDNESDKYKLTVELDPPETDGVTPIASDGVVYLRPYYDGELANILHRIDLSDETGDRGTDEWSSKFPCIPWNNLDGFQDMVRYFEEDFAPHLPEVSKITQALMNDTPNTPADREIQRINEVELTPDLSNRTDDGSNVKKLTVELVTSFAPVLLGAVPVEGPNERFLNWPSGMLLEAIYVPPEMDEQFRREEMNFLQAGIASYSTLSRDIVPVENLTDSVRVKGDPKWAEP